MQLEFARNDLSGDVQLHVGDAKLLQIAQLLQTSVFSVVKKHVRKAPLRLVRLQLCFFLLAQLLEHRIADQRQGHGDEHVANQQYPRLLL